MGDTKTTRPSQYLFFNKESQYRASSSGDLLDDWAILVTALLFMKRPQACVIEKTVKGKVSCSHTLNRQHSDVIVYLIKCSHEASIIVEC